MPHSIPLHLLFLCFPGHSSSFQFGNMDSPSKNGFNSHLCAKELSTISLGTLFSVPYWSQFLPLSNRDLITNLSGLLWRVTKIIRQPPTLSFPIPNPNSLKVSANSFQKGAGQAVPCASVHPTPSSEGREGASYLQQGAVLPGSCPRPAALSPGACYQPP